MRRSWGVALALVATAAFIVLWGGSAAQAVPLSEGLFSDEDDAAMVSGPLDFRDSSGGTNITECPQAGLRDNKTAPLDRRSKDSTEKKGEGGGDIRVNQDFSCLPQDETALDQNPRSSKNYVAGANDYRLGWGTSGFYSITDNGNHWYDGITPFPSLPSGDNLDGGGDPVTVFDRDGIVYYAQINFNRTDDTSGVWVNRSTNGGFTWTRPCVAIGPVGPDEAGVCGGAGDVRQPGDGTVSFFQDNDGQLNGSQPGNDKEWITAGPRPSGVSAKCFTPFTHSVRACDPGVVGCRPALCDVLALLGRRIRGDHVQLLGRPGTIVVGSQAIYGAAAFCHPSWKSNDACDRQPGIPADGQPDDGTTLGRLHQRRHGRRGSVPRRYVQGRRHDVLATEPYGHAL